MWIATTKNDLEAQSSELPTGLKTHPAVAAGDHCNLLVGHAQTPTHDARRSSSTESHFPQIRCAFGFGNLPIRLDGEWRARWGFGRNRVKRVFLNMLKRSEE